ncbi:MAG: Ig-like domain-containing protein [Planctomycetota bacterium]|nr:Ig-like domain-containing protein [Planctomycetota bacterium]
MSASQNRRVRERKNIQSSKKSFLSRMLRLESLERRELMAADFAPFHNYLASTDVDGDFKISPLDALMVINQINTTGSGSLAGRQAPTTRVGLVDADGDNALSPLDALLVINSINRGEGVGELAEIKYEFYALNDNGTLGANLDPNPNDFVYEANVSTGQKFVVRTLMADLRGNPSGIFSAYHDLNFTNRDGSAAEKIQLQWSEYNSLKLRQSDPNGTIGGSFRLAYGSEITSLIPIATTSPRPGVTIPSKSGTADNIRTALEGLPGIGTGNVVVNVNEIDPDPGFNFDIFFRNAKARTDMPNASIAENNLTATLGVINPTITFQDAPSPSQTVVARAAMNYKPIAAQFPLYVNGPNGVLDESSSATGKRTLKNLGSFSNSSAPIPSASASNFFGIVDTAFRAGASGTVDLAATVSQLPAAGSQGENLGIALYNATGVYLTSSQVLLPTAVINIQDRLTAVNDVFTINEDAPVNSYNVVANDVDRFGTSRGIISVTQPTEGGTVSFDGVGTAQTIRFTPAANYNGPVTFTYTIRNNINDVATGTVTMNVTAVNDAPIVINTAFSVTEDPASPLLIAPTDVFSPGPANESSQLITLAIVTPPPANQGTAVINASGILEFTPAANFVGTVNMVVRGTDNGTPAQSTNATLTVTVSAVNDAPVIVQTTYSVAEDSAAGVVILPTQIFTPGPSNESAQTITLSLITLPTASQGVATILPNGSLQFVPALNFFGPVNFVVRGTDNGTPALSADATLTINVTPVNDGPIAVDDTGSSARFNVIGLTGTATPLDVMRNDSAGPNESSIDSIKILSVTTTTLGATVTLNADRTRVIYTPPTTAVNQTDFFSYTIEDNAGLTSTARTEVFILPPTFPFAVDDQFSTSEKTVDTSYPINVTANDFVNDGFVSQIVSIVQQPQAGKGTATVVGTDTPNDPSDDRVVYTAPAHVSGGPILVVYQMTDSKPGSVPVNATLTIQISEVNDPPAPFGKNVSVNEDTTLDIDGQAFTSDISRGPFEDSQTLTITGVQLLTAGSGTVSLVNGNIRFVPSANFNGVAEVLYTVRDNGTTAGTLDPKTASATLTISVSAVNDAPITVAKTLPTPPTVYLEGNTTTIPVADVIAGDRPGPDNESAQSVSLVEIVGSLTTAKGGTITRQGSNLIYTPPQFYNSLVDGQDSFVYSIVDNGTPALSATGTVNLYISEVNNPPVADDLSRDAFAGVNTVIDLTAALAAMNKGAPNESGQKLKITDLILPSSYPGTLTLNPNGTSITYFAPLGTNESFSFQYRVEDNGTTAGQADPLADVGNFTIKVLPFQPSSIKGLVYVDDNFNGVYDNNPAGAVELPVGGVEVTLSYADPSNPSSTIRMVEMTDADGSYDFELLPPGTYTVSYVNPASMIESGSAIRSETFTINPPGGQNLVRQFPVLGINPSYGSAIEYFASSLYLKDATLRSRGMYAMVNSNSGYSEWTSRKDGFEGDRFHEVVLSADGSRAYLTAVRGNGQVFTAVLVEKKQFLRIPAGNGFQYVRILASSSDLVWNPVNINSPQLSAPGYLDAVDNYFTQEGWNV